MHALEGHGRHRAAEMAGVRRDNVNVLGTDDHVDRFVRLKAAVDAGKFASEELHQLVLEHDAVEDIRLADEIRDERVLRLVINILRRTDLLDPALIHDHDGVRHGQRFLLIVGHIDECDPHGLLNALQLVLHVLAQTQIERTQRLVKQQHLRAVDQRARNGHALLLTAGKGSDLPVLKALEGHDLQHLRHALVDLLFAQLGNAQAEGDVVIDIEVREQSVALEHRVDLSLVGGNLIDAFSAEQDVAACRR